MIHYPVPPHLQVAYSEWNQMHFPVTEEIHNQVLSLPMSPVMNENELKSVVEVVNRYNQ
jgi:dTDP-4-amino-4,6-dideoxygalactose transaminase